ncbi:alpha/beta hydrolase-fold protein [Candidatus Nitronereus thalassa]|uniref:Alpha/beta hydrolase-fold protein n=1 Tax=Candidatus Nitronereus thalassa TaxID=3020898 RepID=A0ABU3KBK0_9BACT|nr:alpha/beta hydrolase-fold protein [Candidatus Nitronereus thalassa]MDT7043792.1 alpha/beta hydrolase-fold protein [Candidatus Nitronereus thalassa]
MDAQIDAKTEPSLLGVVRKYLSNGEDALAESVLHEILLRPDASIDRVVDLITHARTFGNAPVGQQPSLSVLVRGRDMSYGLFVPSSYDPSQASPLVVCLHGAGFTGDSYLERWAERLGDSYILVCPTISMGAWWSRQGEELVLATIRAVQSRYHIDPDRIFLTGMSNGGIGAWIIGMHHAPRFAAVAPMAGGIDEVLFPFLKNLSQTPLYVIHGAKDQIMPVWLSRNITHELSQLGIAYIYREHEWTHPHAGGHFFPRQELPSLVKWFGQQRRDPYPMKVTVVRDASHLSEFGWVRIDGTDRIAMFSEQLIDRQDELMKNRIYARLTVMNIKENRIDLTTARVRRYTLFLNDVLIDFSHPITVVTNGIVSFHGRIIPQLETLLREARRRQDPSVLFSAKLTLDVPQ